MKFEIKQEIEFEVEELASAAVEIVDDNFSECVPDYRKLDDDQRYGLLKAIFSKALEFLKEED